MELTFRKGLGLLMQLDSFAGLETIFIDANIFAYFAVSNPAFEKSCGDFFSRILTEQIQAATSTFVLNESFYAITLNAASFALGRQHLLLPTDALHLATCRHYGIHHIATADHHFDNVADLMVWKP